MTSPIQFVTYLRHRGIQLRLQEGSLRVSSAAGAADPDLVKEITARKEELVKFLERLTDPTDVSDWKIPQVPRRTELPLSSGQRRLWFADQLTPDSATYSLPFAYQVEGPFDRLILERALSEIVRRHEILRTRFSAREAKPYQTVLPPQPVSIAYLDLTSLNEAERQRSIEATCRTESKTPFSLEQPPLFRVTLIRQAPERHLLLFTIHHIISDAWSMDVLKRELSELYVAYARNQSSPLAEPSLQYADFAAWESGIDYKSGRQKARLNYWCRTLAGAAPLLELPTSRPRTAERTSKGRALPVNVSGDLLDRLTKLGQKEHCSLFMTSLAIFAALLFRYTGQEDICIGAPVAGRITPELDDLIGFFVNSLVFRFDLSGDPSVRSLLHQVRERVMQGLEYQDVPFDRVVEELNPERTSAYSPLFQVAFAFRNNARLTSGLTDNQIREVSASGTGTAMYDLTLHFSETSGLLSGWLEYSCDLFDEDMIERMVSHYINLLEAACNEPDAMVGTLPMLGALEKKKLLETWNETLAPFDAAACIHDLVARQSIRTPEQVAVTDMQTTLTYSELDSYSNQIARKLVELGCGPQVRVAVCLQRSATMVAALLGVLKAGSPYVPVDPMYPEARIQFIVDDTSPAVVICDETTHTRFEDRYTVLNLTTGSRCLADGTPNDPLAATCRPSDAAYIIYTSGSTGQPKGVEIEHRNAVSFLSYAVKLFGDDLGSSLASSTICFDASILEIFAPLSMGGTVLVVSDVTELTTLRFAYHPQITFVFSAPSAIGELLQTPSVLQGIRTFSLGGEPLPTSLVRQIYAVEGVRRVIDVYGPTETTTFSTCALRDPDGPPTVGKPIDNTRIYILDRYKNPVPVGVSGELFIAGAGVSRGYWNRPALTRERFLHELFGHDESARMYKTGDQARYRSDGNIEIIGRFDDQVKVRGYRIELGEVEHVLMQHPSMRECGAAVARSPEGVPRLVACVAVNSESITPDNIRQFAAERLPAYMTPGNIFIRSSVPRTTSGKIDRKQITTLWDDRDSRLAHTGPKNAVEAELLKIWSSIFPGRTVGTQDNFFDLGGHSLLALRMLHKIETACGQRLSLSVFFHAQTIETLGTYLHHGRTLATWKSLVPLRTTGSRPPLFLIHGSGGSLLAFKDLLQILSADQPVYGLQYTDNEFQSSTRNFIEELSAQFVREIQQVQPHGPYRLLGHCAGGSIVYEMACQLSDQGERVAMAGLLDAFQRPFKLRPSVRAQRRLELIREHFTILLRDETRVSYARAKLEKFRGELIDGFRRRLAPQVPILPRDLEQATLFFVPRPYSGNVQLFRSVDSASEFLDIPYDYGWGQVVGGKLDIYELPGDHLTLLNAPHVQILSEQLTRLLADDGSDAGSVATEENSEVVA